MGFDGLGRDAWREVDPVRCLRGSATRAAAVAQTFAGVLAGAPPGFMRRQEALSQALANDKRRRNPGHVGSASPRRHFALNAPHQHARPAKRAQAIADSHWRQERRKPAFGDSRTLKIPLLVPH